jgi:hypothetical protein
MILALCKSGITSDWTCGLVTDAYATVDYSDDPEPSQIVARVATYTCCHDTFAEPGEAVHQCLIMLITYYMESYPDVEELMLDTLQGLPWQWINILVLEIRLPFILVTQILE